MRLLVVLLLTAVSAFGETLPGFRVENVGQVEGFVSSVVVDSKGTIYTTTTDGWIYRIVDGQTTRVASLPTRAGSNGGLLGMALLDDSTAVVHYTVWGGEDLVVDDVISRVDLASGAETVVRAFACDVDVHARGASPEHHGGNPIIAPDGSIFVAIGEYGSHSLAQRPGWNGGRVWRIDGAGNATQWALGLRNPFDLAWDPELQRIVLADNGPTAGDEIHLIEQGSNCGWPRTFGTQPPVEGMIAPDYVFPDTVAPTGLLRLDGSNTLLSQGYLLGSFVTRSLYYFPSLATKPIADPIPIVAEFEEVIIDVTQSSTGEIYFVSASFGGTSSVRRLRAPARGDCNGDGLRNGSDILALLAEIDDGDSEPFIEAQTGAFVGSWGCDANADGVINAGDLDALRTILSPRRRSVR